MKKVITILLMGLFLACSVGSVSAEEKLPFGEEREAWKRERMEQRQAKFEMHQEFVDELHSINSLRMERNNLQNQVIQKQDALIDLYIAATEANDEESLQEAGEVRSQIKDVNDELREIHKQTREERKAFREQLREGNLEAAQTHIDQVIALSTQANEKVNVKINLLQQIIDILS
ncbi:MAG: hypothetical protein ACOYVD_19575 [Bacillota bacterium]